MLLFFVALNVILCCNGQSPEEELIVDFVKQEKCENPSKPGDALTIMFIRTTPPEGDASEQLPLQNHIEFTLGSGEVIQGWEKALAGKCKGDNLVIMVPEHLNKGGRGKGRAINPSKSAMFIIEILSVKEPEPKPASMNAQKTFQELDKDGNQEVTRDEARLYIMQTQGGKGGPAIPPSILDHLVNAIMDQDDKNKDGVIQAHEFKGDDAHHRPHDEL